METLATLPYPYNNYLPPRSSRQVQTSRARTYPPIARSHSRKVSNDAGVDEAFWKLEEQQKQDRLINVILALLHI